MAKHDLWPDMSADPPSPLLKWILNFYKLPDFPTVSLRALCLAPAIFFHRPRGQLIVIAQLLKICPLGFTEAKGLTPGSQPVFMPLPTKGFVMNREPQETKAFSKDKQLCSIHQHLCSPPPARPGKNTLSNWDHMRLRVEPHPQG